MRELSGGPGANESEEQLRFVANALPALIAYVDGDGRYVWANESYRRWFGYPPERVRGLHASEVLGADAWSTLRPYVERALAGEEVMFDHRITYKNGPPRDVRASYIPRRDAAGRVIGFAVMVNDITEIRAAEAALRHSEDMLEQSQSSAHVGSWEAELSDDGHIGAGAVVGRDLPVARIRARRARGRRSELHGVHPPGRQASRSATTGSRASRAASRSSRTFASCGRTGRCACFTPGATSSATPPAS